MRFVRERSRAPDSLLLSRLRTLREEVILSSLGGIGPVRALYERERFVSRERELRDARIEPERRLPVKIIQFISVYSL